MKKMRALAALAALVVLAPASAQQRPQPASETGYLTPPKVIVDILDATPTPNVVVSPDRRTIALLERHSMPTIADLAQPIHRIAGTRINPKTNGRQLRTGGVFAVTLKSVADGRETKLGVPKDARIGGVSFSLDGKRVSFTNTRDNGIELWVAETATGRARLLSGTDRLNGNPGDPCDWLEDSQTLL